MKLSQLILALSVSISGAAFAADNHGHDLKPMHGGAVAEAKEVEYEFVASADKLQLYMRDHGKPVAGIEQLHFQPSKEAFACCVVW